MTAETPTKRVRSLDGVRVLEFPDPKSAFCGRMLSLMGADVLLVEPPGGATIRGLPPVAEPSGESLLFWYTCANKRSIVLDLGEKTGRESLMGLIERADVVIDPFPPGRLESFGLGPEVLLGANPHLVLASVTPFGQTGPFRDYAGSDIVGWAMGGLMGLTGDPEREPLTAPGLQAYQVASLWATLGVLGALFRRVQTGQGARLDVSVQEAVFDMSETAHTFYLATREVPQRTNGDHPMAVPFRSFRTMDGHAFVGAISQQQWAQLLQWMGSEGFNTAWLRGADMAATIARHKVRAEVNRAVAEFAARHTAEELWVKGASLGMGNAPIRPVAAALEDEQVLHRRFFARMADPRGKAAGGPYQYPGLPFMGRDGSWWEHVEPPPRAGQHTAEVLQEWKWPSRVWPEPNSPTRTLPLEGVKVADLCWNMAGPVMARLLGDLGATVVKNEIPEAGDSVRNAVPFPNGQPNPAWSYTFQDVHRNKLGVTLNLKHPRCWEVASRLASWADVFLENFTSGTMGRLGLPYERLAQANPGLIMASITGYGQTGPRASWPSYHPTASAMCGLTHLFAYEGGEPQGFAHSYMDFVPGYVGAIGVMDALLRRARTGKGDHVDVSQLDSGICMVGVELMDWAVNRRMAEPRGNRAGALGALLQGCYRCRGDDAWIVVTVPDREALDRLQHVIGIDWAGSVAAAEEALRTWARLLEPWEAFRLLQEERIPAGVVSVGADLVERDAHLRAREALAWLPHQEGGLVPIAQCPLVLDGRRLAARRVAPLLGEHTEVVLRDFLGIGEATYLEYIVEGVV